MSRDEATPQDEQLAALLAAFDEALATGAAPPGDVPAAARPRLDEDLECLQLLHRLRPGLPAPTEVPESGERYTLRHLHAAGGIGEVWLAHDADLDREVALKELRTERARNPALAARFLREARITGQLQHPGIVPVYELVPGTKGPDGEAEPTFYTMRFVQGRTLTEAATAYHARRGAGAAGPLELTGLLNAFVSVCNTVAYAHSRGVIHRDLKGENVVLGDFGEVMVLDWGFAKIKDEDERSNPKDDPQWMDTSFAVRPTAFPSEAGQVLGTPAYMAPEQAAGRPDLIDFRTDVYGLGAILHEILTGRPPYTGASSREVLQKVRESKLARLDTICPVPPALAAVCARALARDPSARYPSAAELGCEVQHWLADEPVTAYREPAAARLQRWARRHRQLVVGLVVLLATGLVALVVGTFLLEAEQSRTAAVRAQAAAEKAEAEVEARETLEVQLYHQRIALAERELAANNLSRATQLLAACPERLRGWEWHCLKRLCHADVRTLPGTSAVSAIAFSPDGGSLASASHDGIVRLWNVRTGQVVRALAGHADVVYGLAYSPDGHALATASWDRTVKVWDPQSGREHFTCRGHTEAVWRVAYSSDARYLASLSSGTVKIWDAQTGAELRTLGRIGGLNRYGMAFSPEGSQLAVTTHHPAVTIWNPTTGAEGKVFGGHTSVPKNVAFSPDGKLLASGAGDIARTEPGEVCVWEAETAREVWRLRGHTDPIYGVVFSPDGRRLVSASQDHTVKIWDPQSGREVLTLRAHSDTVRAVAFSPDGWCLATACADGTIKLWDATPWADDPPAHKVQTLAGHGAAVFVTAFHPDGQRLAALSDNETIRTWDLEHGRELEELRVSRGPQLYALALSPDGKLLATATTDGVVFLLDPATRQTKRILQGHSTGPIKCLAFSPDSRRLAMAHWERSVWVWDVESGRPIHSLKGHADAVLGVAFSPDGKYLASASYDKTVRIWDADMGTELHKLAEHTSRVFSVAFSPDGKTLASGSNDGTIRLWDPTTGKARRTLRKHASAVYGVAFSPDGRLASASNDWTVKLWNPTTGAVLQTLRGHTDRVHCVAFSPDGRRLASASSDQTVKVWETPP
jgi:eukaryotic-like serine/threonine-protein kinase